MVNFAKYLVLFIFVTKSAFAFETRAEQAYLLDLDTGTVLFQKNADEKMHPSSMSKLMATYVLFKKLKAGDISLDSEFTVSKKAWQTGGSKTFLDVDSKVKVQDLLRGMVVQSGNDATITIAEGIGGDEEAFVEEMSKYARELGLKNSSFANSTGLTDPEHLMSARDLAILAKQIITEFPDLYPYFAEQEFTYNDITQQNRNTLIGEIGVDGMKTGYTEAGGYGLVSSASQDGRRLIAVVNGLGSDSERIQETRNLLNYGFKNFRAQKVFPANHNIGEASVWYGTKSSIPLVVAKDVNILKTPKDNSQPESRVIFTQPIMAPIKKGDLLGRLEIKLSADNIQYVELVAQEDVEKASLLRRMFQNARTILKENIQYFLG